LSISWTVSLELLSYIARSDGNFRVADHPSRTSS
jgi:hypothetical protein